MISITKAKEISQKNQFEIDRHAKSVIAIEECIDKDIKEAAYYGYSKKCMSFYGTFGGDGVWIKLSDVVEVAEKYKDAGYMVEVDTERTQGGRIAVVTISWR